MLKNNDWIIINAITYKIHSITDCDEMRLSLMQQLAYVIDYDSASFYQVNPREEHDLCNPLGINYSKTDMEQYIHQYKNLDYSEGLMFTGKNIAYRESDLVEDEVRINTKYYKSVYDVQGWHYSLHLNICYKEKFLGILSFFRKKGEEDFSYDDIFVLDMIKDHLAFRLWNLQKEQERKRMTVDECSKKYQLSNQETSILQELITDITTEEIAQKYNISISTLRKHCNHIYHKMGVAQRIQLYDKVQMP